MENKIYPNNMIAKATVRVWELSQRKKIFRFPKL